MFEIGRTLRITAGSLGPHTFHEMASECITVQRKAFLKVYRYMVSLKNLRPLPCIILALLMTLYKTSCGSFVPDGIAEN